MSSRYSRYEVSVGVFVLVGIVSLLYLSISLGELRFFSEDRYTLTARFSSVAGLKTGDPVKIAGVTVGEVGEIRLEDYQALLELKLNRGVALSVDTIASVQSAGLLGDSYVSLAPGAEDSNLAEGGRIARTEPAVSLTELIAKYAFGSPVEDNAESRDSDHTAPQQGEQDPKKEKESPFANPLE
jgi:phospholipid/cholesterol/gamma-HCH transport system substrate-binding protein